jgi:hypothetical protein
MALNAIPKINHSTLEFRPASLVMDLERLGSLYPYPLSFMRSLVRRMMNEKWTITPVVFDLDEHGYGDAVYEVVTPNQTYSYVIFSKFLDPENRSDRVIAEDWDMTVTLCEGTVDKERLGFLRENVPLQELGRVDSKCIVLSRANKSVRNYQYVVDALSKGQQPDLEVMAKVGYLYRTTAVYGSGKFGMADWEKVRESYPDFASPFAAEMFSCYLIRHFSLEKADWVAKKRAPETAIAMDDTTKRYVGIGNATGLGMSPYLINHPILIANWIEVRETALARIISNEIPNSESAAKLKQVISKAIQHLNEISTDNAQQNIVNENARSEIELCLIWFNDNCSNVTNWSILIEHVADNFSKETQELLNAILTEIYPDVILDLETQLNVTESYEMIPHMKLSELQSKIKTHYDWVLNLDFDQKDALGTFWYRSEEKQEPRLGQRYEEPGAEKEMMMCIARDVKTCFQDLGDFQKSEGDKSVAHFVFEHPEHRYIVRRIQAMSATRYGEIRANLLDADVLPIHLLRCKLSFFGVGKFDPRSKMWVRNTMFQGAPLVSDIGQEFIDDWYFPTRPDTNG